MESSFSAESRHSINMASSWADHPPNNSSTSMRSRPSCQQMEWRLPCPASGVERIPRRNRLSCDREFGDRPADRSKIRMERLRQLCMRSASLHRSVRLNAILAPMNPQARPIQRLTCAVVRCSPPTSSYAPVPGLQRLSSSTIYQRTHESKTLCQGRKCSGGVRQRARGAQYFVE
jgi:hypothetical protein